MQESLDFSYSRIAIWYICAVLFPYKYHISQSLIPRKRRHAEIRVINPKHPNINLEMQPQMNIVKPH